MTANIRFVAETVFKHTQEQIKSTCACVHLRIGLPKKKRFECVRKEQIVPLETGIPWEISYKLLRPCILLAKIFQGTGEKPASGPAVGFTGPRTHMFGWVCPFGIPALGAGGLHVPRSSGPGCLPDSCFAEKWNTGEV